ncbi:L-seryl-tRNA selenium transferase family protein [Helicobacter pylori SouthAfrica50]|uniref:L-seryl-tRNA selenium transferase family protein n=1 Tax=Helicobacter pylori SouthAfrica50 TaxID=1352357 RepID=T2SAZ4_HELPX|nr:L-seryl-tRNA selenium transferase family protein [Helicobacter pylori SouthAfrica50]
MANITTKETPEITPDLLENPYQKIINASASVFDENHGRSFFSPKFYERIEPHLKEILTHPIDLECDLNTAKKRTA